MIAWVGIVLICIASFIAYIFYKAMSSLSYEQGRWVELYKQEERSSMSRKLQQRASDLAQEITKQFLLKERPGFKASVSHLFCKFRCWALIDSDTDQKVNGKEFLEYILQNIAISQMVLIFFTRLFMSGLTTKQKINNWIQLSIYLTVMK